ncbi:diaminopimelate epimerase [Pseudoroseicyclus tamaricis]|uniref:Diaminopimelate epimerase n=1 Tax=Pseudoroseicyclus tamaricis TaxID=2705421 RepID=A0A6B2K702_9RHOB|nr:diaminopimelate epimerase [Pseudoroseicyclus tamaricis]NDV02726.1 diaminopimelate epimerase [Pseudoroseicyclus tamaricis]
MRDSPASGLPFAKMHGAGNDFVVIDQRRSGAGAVAPALVAALADRHRGVGFDQLAVITPADGADFGLTFYNADGSLSAACGNATRCIAAAEMGETGERALTIRTGGGLLRARSEAGGVAVNMGPPRLTWEEIPLAEQVDTLSLPIEGEPAATSMGNPHCTFFVADAEAIEIAELGPKMEHHPLFPERTNVQVVSLIGENRLRMRVWERGAGLTLASGSSTCAVVAAAHRRGLTGRRAEVVADGGVLAADWREDGIWLTGPVAHVFDGVLTAAFLERV